MWRFDKILGCFVRFIFQSVYFAQKNSSNQVTNSWINSNKRTIMNQNQNNEIHKMQRQKALFKSKSVFALYVWRYYFDVFVSISPLFHEQCPEQNQLMSGCPYALIASWQIFPVQKPAQFDDPQHHLGQIILQIFSEFDRTGF